MADLSSRARPSSLSSLPFLLLATFLFLSFTATSSLALSHPPHGSLPNHIKRVVQPRDDDITVWESPASPRPTPEPVAGGLEKLIAAYANFSTSLTESELTKRAGCVGNGTTIAQFNQYFATRGANSVLLLCPGSVFNVTATILFAATGQGLQTEGGSSIPWDQRAKLVVTNSKIATAIQANGCINCNNLLVDSLVIDGGRLELGPMTDGGGLLEMGGTCKNHTITNNKISNTRGWSSIHIIEGVCSGAVISNNIIGPAGDSYSVGPIADGISLACKTSFVQNNEIFDVSDGAIVIFQAPGSIVSNNTITAINTVMLGGINMVDFSPYSGSYTGTLVYNNTILADGAHIKIGIAQGAANWGDSTTLRNYGAKVYENTFGGTRMSFGLSIAGVKDWAAYDNVALDSARFKGVKGVNCHGLGGTVEPTFAIIDPFKTANVTLGDDANCWTQGTLQYLLCYLADNTTNTGTAPEPAFVAGGTCTASALPPAASSAWKDSKYCLQDANNTRVLVGNYIQQSRINSVSYCTNLCTSLNYIYAGMENGTQCFCSENIVTGEGFGTVLNASSCALPCVANASQTCGGANYAMGLWYDSLRVEAPVAPFTAAAPQVTTSSGDGSDTGSGSSDNSTTTGSSSSSLRRSTSVFTAIRASLLSQRGGSKSVPGSSPSTLFFNISLLSLASLPLLFGLLLHWD